MKRYIKIFVCAFFWLLLLPVRLFIGVIAFLISLIIHPILFLCNLCWWACDDDDFDWNPIPFYKNLFWGLLIKGNILNFLEGYLV